MRNGILACVEMAEIEPDPEERRRLLTFVVAGGSFGGVEVATELLEHVRSLAGREYPHIRPVEPRVGTDEFVRVPGTTDVRAGGDCAAVPDPNGGSCPQLAIYAFEHGRQIGRNILRTVEGRPLERYRFSGLGEMCSLGRRHAIGHFKGKVYASGFVARVL